MGIHGKSVREILLSVGAFGLLLTMGIGVQDVLGGQVGRVSLVGSDFSAWQLDTGQWQIVHDVFMDPNNEKMLAGKPGTGVIVNGPTGKTSHLITKGQWQDVTAHVEFMVPKGSNSGVYFMGRYEVQVYDSWGVAAPTYTDCGGIYERWDENRTPKGYEGRAPRVNASRPPGQWQSFDVVFRAPRFDEAGKKISSARFEKVVHNGVVVHENVEVIGPTRSSAYNDEKSAGPLMLQGDHGAVAYRNIWIEPAGPNPSLVMGGAERRDAAVPPTPATVPAFPGAEGAGAITPGGRGGKVIEVTNLNDSGPGSLREAIDANGPRIVIFRISGIITLEKPLAIANPFITIAGQTAPGDGICIRGATTEINTHDVVIRYLRFRRGNIKDRNDGLGGYPVGNIIVDHCSASWGLDENISMYRFMQKTPGAPDKKTPTENLTIQWCIMSEGLDLNNHAFGGTWGGKNGSFHHNLFACNTGRNPSIGWGDHFDFRNNVLFNWRHRTVDGGDASSMVNVVANYYKPGPATNSGPLQYLICRPQHLDMYAENKRDGKWYVAENFVAGNPKVTADNWAGGVRFDGAESEAQIKALVEKVRATSPIPATPITQQSAEQAYELVLAQAGAALPKRDPVDVRIIESVRTGKPTFGNGIIDTPADVGGWPEYKSLPAPVDSDHDGMPDEWEKKFGLNPNDPSDGEKDLDGDGYTNVEEWLNDTNPKGRAARSL